MKIHLIHPSIGHIALALRRGRGLVLGRHGIDADVELNWDDTISRRHARIWMNEGHFWFEDLGSTNGSWLDERPIEGPIRLEPGMQIRLGATRLSVPDPLTPFEFEADVTQTTSTLCSVR